ncbi:MAG: hypothetical protein ACUVS3_16945 [Thermodesulfobacteriota bacterium]
MAKAGEALARGSVEELAEVAAGIGAGIREWVAPLVEASKHKDESVPDGRKVVAV